MGSELVLRISDGNSEALYIPLSFICWVEVLMTQLSGIDYVRVKVIRVMRTLPGNLYTLNECAQIIDWIQTHKSQAAKLTEIHL